MWCALRVWRSARSGQKRRLRRRARNQHTLWPASHKQQQRKTIISQGDTIMKIATVIARSLLGLIFVVFGSNMFLHFIPMPPPEGPARDFMTALFASHYLY